MTDLVMMGTIISRAQTAPISPPMPMRSVEVKSKHADTHNSPSTFALEVRISARMISQKGTADMRGENIIRRNDLCNGNHVNSSVLR